MVRNKRSGKIKITQITLLDMNADWKAFRQWCSGTEILTLYDRAG